MRHRIRARTTSPASVGSASFTSPSGRPASGALSAVPRSFRTRPPSPPAPPANQPAPPTTSTSLPDDLNRPSGHAKTPAHTDRHHPRPHQQLRSPVIPRSTDPPSALEPAGFPPDTSGTRSRHMNTLSLRPFHQVHTPRRLFRACVCYLLHVQTAAVANFRNGGPITNNGDCCRVARTRRTARCRSPDRRGIQRAQATRSGSLNR